MEKMICDLCDKPFTSKGEKVNHMIHIHTVRTKELHCDFCEEIYDSKLDLCQHISSMHGEYFIKKEETEEMKPRKKVKLMKT